MNLIEIERGDSPVVLGLPHTGTLIPEALQSNYNALGLEMADTDWHIHDLYAGLLQGVTSVRTQIHRYVIDVNRDPAGHSLYPGQNTTSLCPLTDFDGQPIYRKNQAPDAAEIDNRRAKYHAPYHVAISAELARVQALHGFAILYDCHSIRGQIPFLFDGTLPDFNIGTNLGTTCAPEIEALTYSACQAADGYSHILNGRFKGGWTTRHYGRPNDAIHAIQMELAQATYMQDSAPWTYEQTRAQQLRLTLTKILTSLANWSPT